MMSRKREWIGLTLISLMIISQGCQRTEEANTPKLRLSDSKILQHPSNPATNVVKPEPVPVQPETKLPPKPELAIKPPSPKPAMPQVVLSAEQLATCLVKVGDRMPNVDLPDTDGKPRSLASLRGKNLTVLFFWTVDSPYSQDEAGDLNDLVHDYAQRGVNVIGITHGDATSEKVRPKIKELGLTFPVLLDTGSSYFAKLAKEKPLRTYLFDADGKILWFDVEYSRTTRRDLLQAIDTVLGKAK